MNSNTEVGENSRGELYRVNVYFLDEMPVTRNIRETVELCRRAYRRLQLPETDMYVYKNLTKGGYMIKMARHNRLLLLQTKAGNMDYYVSPNTLLETLKNGFVPLVDEK